MSQHNHNLKTEDIRKNKVVDPNLKYRENALKSPCNQTISTGCSQKSFTMFYQAMDVVGYCMDTVFRVLRVCEENGCTVLPPRGAVAFIACFGLIVCAADLSKDDNCLRPRCDAQEMLDSLQQLLTNVFTMANLLLLLATITENPLLVQLYVSYTMGHVLLGLMMAIAAFLLKTRRQGVARACTVLVPEAAFLFMLFRCLPLVDAYRNHLDGITSIES